MKDTSKRAVRSACPLDQSSPEADPTGLPPATFHCGRAHSGLILSLVETNRMHFKL